MKCLFTNWSLTTPASNIKEIYINHFIEGEQEHKAFRIRILDDSKVKLSFFSHSHKVTKIDLDDGTCIYEGEKDDVNYPHFYPNRDE